MGKGQGAARLLGGALLGASLLAGCGSDPVVSGGAPDPEVEAVAIVRAERLLADGAPAGGAKAPGPFDRIVVGGRVAPLVDQPSPTGLGRKPHAWVASAVVDGAWRLVFKSETGPCIIDCAVQRYWYFTVSPLGGPRPAGTYAVTPGAVPGTSRAEGAPLWGFPGDAERRLLAAARAAAH